MPQRTWPRYVLDLFTQVITGSPAATSFGIDDVYIAIQTPPLVLPGGGATFMGGVTGGAGWGPKGSQIICNTPQDLLTNFGFPINSGFDLVQEGALFLKQLPRGGLVCTRVAHTGDAASTGTIVDTGAATGLTITALYTGSFGNQIQVGIFQGSKYQAGTPVYKIVVQTPFAIEVFDNLAGGLSGNAVWVALAAAINNGAGPNRPASAYITAAATASVATVQTNGTAGQLITLSGGLDGATGLTTSDLVGTDGPVGTKTGMYANVRSSGVDVFWLAGCSDSTTWSTMATLAQQENCMGIGAFPKATTTAAAVTAKLTAGIDTPYMTLLKDWVTYFDTTSTIQANVTVPPSAVAAGVCCRMNSHESPGNQQVNAILGTERTLASNPQAYPASELAQLRQTGINIITNPIPSARAFGMRHGRNTSSNFATCQIAYTRKLNDIVRGLGGPSGIGQLVDRPQSSRSGDALRDQMRTLLQGFFGPMKNPAAGGDPTIDDYAVICDLTNNSANSIAAGICAASVAVKFLAIAETVLINITAGQTVQISVQSTNALGQPVGS